MTRRIKINNKEHDVEYSYDIINDWLKNGELIELRDGEYFCTKKHFVKVVLGLSKIVPFPDKFKIYLFALRLQFTDLYPKWMATKEI
jgi:hypothetical protein